MGENLVAGILKSIETLSTINLNHNVAIFTSIKKTNLLLSNQIGKELAIQTNLLKTIALNLTQGSNNKKVSEETPSKGLSSLFKGNGSKGISEALKEIGNLSKKGGSKSITLLSSSIDKLTESINKFKDVINEIDEKKFKLFTDLVSMGKKILLFAALVALSAPLLAIGLITTIPILFLWVKFFNWVGRESKEINKGAKMLMYMALATAIITLTVIMSAFALGDPLKTLMAFTLVAGSLLILSGAFYLISLASKPLNTGTKVLLAMALATALIVFTVIMASKFIGGPMETLIAFGLMAGSLLVLTVAFYFISKVKGDMINGAIALLIGAVAIMVLGAAVMVWMKANATLEEMLLLGTTIFGLAIAMSFAGKRAVNIAEGAIVMILSSVGIMILAKAVETWMNSKASSEDMLLLGATIVGLGVAMAGWGAASFLIIPGAAALVIAAGGLYIFTKSMINFKEAKWTTTNTDELIYSIKTILTGFIDIFDDISFSDITKAMLGTKLLGDLGNSLSSFAEGLSAFASGQKPEYGVKKGKLILKGTKPLGADLGKRVGETIKAMVDPLVGENSVLAQLGAGQGLIFDGPIGNGIDLLARLGNSLTNFAKGIQAMATLNVPTYEVDSKGNLILKSVEKLSPTFATDMRNNIAMMLEPLVGKSGGDGSDSILGRLSAGQGLIFDGPIGNGIDLLERLGNSLGGFAKGVQAWADFKIPVYGKNAKGELTVVDYKPMNADFATKVSENIKKMVSSLTAPLEELGKKDGGWFSSSDYELGIKILSELGSPLESLANAAKKFYNLKIDNKKLSATISGTINAFVGALSKTSLENLDEEKGKKVLDGFNYFASAVEKMKGGETDKVGTMFVSIKDSINKMDLAKLNKLNDLAHNLSEFAKNMKGSFGELEDVLEQLVDVIKEMNGIEIKSKESKPVAPVKAPLPTKAVAQTAHTNNQMNLDPLLAQLKAIKDTLMGGIEVEIKDNMLSRK